MCKDWRILFIEAEPVLPVGFVAGRAHVEDDTWFIEKAGFAVGSTRYGSHDDYDSGVVISQNPVAGAQATPGVKIDLVIND